MDFNSTLINNLKSQNPLNYLDTNNCSDFIDFSCKRAITNILDESETIAEEIKNNRKDN